VFAGFPDLADFTISLTALLPEILRLFLPLTLAIFISPEMQKGGPLFASRLVVEES
jgi:hypothetical protein